MELTDTASFNRWSYLCHVIYLFLFCTCLTSDVSAQSTVFQKAIACNANGTSKDCVCSNFQVICVGIPSQVVPSDIMPTVINLTMIHMNLLIVQFCDFCGLEELETLILTYNQIASIHHNAFKNLYKLKNLYLENNKIGKSGIDMQTFQHLTSLQNLNLMRNYIRNLNKYSFLTLPAAGNVTVNLSGNEITCDCDVKALQLWQSTAPGNNVQFTSLVCANDQNNQSFTQVPDNLFGDCTTNLDLIFNTNSTCYTCQGQKTNYGCMLQGQQACPLNQNICLKTVQWDPADHAIVISSTCENYTTCLLKEQGNRQTCGLKYTSNGKIICNFCCLGPTCMNNTIGGRTLDFTFYLTFGINGKYEDYMNNSHDETYVNEENKIRNELRTIWRCFTGGVDLYINKFEKLDDKQFYLQLRVEMTVFSNETLRTVADMLGFCLNSTSQALAFYTTRNVIHYTISNQAALPIGTPVPSDTTIPASGSSQTPRTTTPSSPITGTTVSSTRIPNTPDTSTPVSRTQVPSTPTTGSTATSTPVSSTQVPSTPTTGSTATSTPVSSTQVPSTPTTGSTATSTPMSSTQAPSTPTTGSTATSTPVSSTQVPSTPNTGSTATSTPVSSTKFPSTPTTGPTATSTPVSSTQVPSTSTTGTTDTSTPVSSTQALITPTTGYTATSTPVSSTQAPSTPTTGPTATNNPVSSTQAPSTPTTGPTATSTPVSSTKTHGTPVPGSSPAPGTPESLMCGSITTSTENKGTIFWPSASIGETLTLPCPYKNPLVSNIPFATLSCTKDQDGKVSWGQPDFSACSTLEKSQQKPDPEEIFNTNITPETAQNVSHLLKVFTSNSSDVTLEKMHKVVNALEQLSDKTMLAQPQVVNNVIECISNLASMDDKLLTEAEAKSGTSKRLLKVIDKVPEEAPLDNENSLKVVTPQLVIAAQGVNLTEKQDLSLTASTNSEGDLTNVKVKMGFVLDSLSALPPAATTLVIPIQAIFSSLASETENNFNRVTFAVHKTDKLFASLGKQGNGRLLVTTIATDTTNDTDAEFDKSEPSKKRALVLIRKINSHVISASVPGVEVKDLSDNITMTFQHNSTNATNPQCVYWDVNLYDGEGGWSHQGCGLVRSSKEETTCGCNHLTNFALLMDVYQEGSNLSELDRKILSIISYIGCAVSLFALLLTLLTYSIFRKLRRDNPSKILINLCLALLLANLIFLVGMQEYTFDSSAGCQAVAVLLHYFLLASLTWMAVEAFYMYLALVVVFKTYFTNFLLKCSLVGWGVPLAVVIVTLAVNATDNYGFINSGMCWLRNPAFYAAFVAPVCFILLINCLAFGLVVKQLLSMSSTKLNKTDRSSTIQRLRGAVGVVVLLGLSWLFAIFAIDQASVVFYYLFAVINSLQGLFIFIFYCLLKKDALIAWKRILPCFEEYGDTSKSSSNSRGVTATAHHLGKQNANSRSEVDNGNTLSFTCTSPDSRKSSLFNGEKFNNLFNTSDEADSVTDNVTYGLPSSLPLKQSHQMSGHPLCALSCINPSDKPEENCDFSMDSRHYQTTQLDHPEPDYDTDETPESQCNKAADLYNPENFTQTQFSRPFITDSLNNSSPSYDQEPFLHSYADNSKPSPTLSASECSETFPSSKEEIDYTRSFKVQDLRFKLDRTGSETSDREITKI